MSKVTRSLAAAIANSFIFAQGRQLYSLNCQDWSYPLSKSQKILVGGYMILRDYAAGKFPPISGDEHEAFEAEKNYVKSLTHRGAKLDEVRRYGLQKPFLPDRSGVRYLRHFALLLETLLKLPVAPPAKILEVGCGTGWMSEFLAAVGYQVTAATIDPKDGDAVDRRRASLNAKELNPQLVFRDAPMEYLSDATSIDGLFDLVFVYEALHHAHDWKKALFEFSKVLRPGGWCLICHEPNRIHTFSSYRLGRLSNTHEVGMSRSAIIRELKRNRFDPPRTICNRFHFWVRPIWLAAQFSSGRLK
jgi:SAM-dependent methyltransferase